MAEMPIIDPEKCNGCGLCVNVCRNNALILVNNVITIIGSILAGSLTGISGIPGANQIGSADVMWYFMIGLPLLVSISSGINAKFKFDLKYHSCKESYEKLVQEGWNYLALSGKYSKYISEEKPHFIAASVFLSQVNVIVQKSGDTNKATEKNKKSMIPYTRNKVSGNSDETYSETREPKINTQVLNERVNNSYEISDDDIALPSVQQVINDEQVINSESVNNKV